MALAITNKVINLPPHFVGIGESTNNQYPSTTTATSTSISSYYFEFADYTTTGAIPLATQVAAGSVGDFQVEHHAFRALCYFKQYGAATATTTSTAARLTQGGPLVTLEAATSTGYQPLYILDHKLLPSDASTSLNSTGAGGPCVFMFGMVPISAGARYARINFYTNGQAVTQASSTALDVIIQAV